MISHFLLIIPQRPVRESNPQLALRRKNGDRSGAHIPSHPLLSVFPGNPYFIRKNNFSDYCQTCLYRSVKTCDKLAGN